MQSELRQPEEHEEHQNEQRDAAQYFDVGDHDRVERRIAQRANDAQNEATGNRDQHRSEADLDRDREPVHEDVAKCRKVCGVHVPYRASRASVERRMPDKMNTNTR